jgi:hypothetical protein
MSKMQYKLEYNYDTEDPADAGCYIQLRDNTPVYRSHTDKEDYDILPEEEKHPWLTGIFNISGVVEVSSRAYRVWVMKSPVYGWQEVLEPTLYFMADYLGHEDGIEPLPGTADVKDEMYGWKLDHPKNRRDR